MCMVETFAEVGASCGHRVWGMLCPTNPCFLHG